MAKKTLLNIFWNSPENSMFSQAQNNTFRITYVDGTIDWVTLNNMSAIQSDDLRGINCLSICNVDLTMTNITLISVSTFSDFQSLSSISLPESLKLIEISAFAECYNLSSIKFPDSVSAIEKDAFAYTPLTSFNIPKSLSFPMSYNAFPYTSLDNCEIIIPDTFTQVSGTHVIDNSTNTLYSIASLLSSSYDFKYNEFYVPDGVQNIGDFSLYTQSSNHLNVIYLPDSIQTFSKNALDPNTGNPLSVYGSISDLDCIEYGNSYIKLINTRAFTSEKLDESISNYIPISSVQIDLNSEWRIPQQWTNTNPDFDVYESYSNHNVNNGYAKMFIKVNGYNDLTIYINSYAAEDDYTLAFVPDYNPTSLPSGSSIGGNVKGTTHGYQGNPSSYGITSGVGWKRVDYILDGCEHTICICYRKDEYGHFNWDRGYVAIPKSKSKYNTKFTPVLSSCYNSIAKDTFKNMLSIAYVSIPETVEVIASNAFSGCASLKRINASGVNCLGNCAFQDCPSLTSVTLGPNLSIINDSAFDNCYSLSSFDFRNITQIQENNFQDSKLTSFIAPNLLCCNSAINPSNLQKADFGKVDNWPLSSALASELTSVKIKTINSPGGINWNNYPKLSCLDVEQSDYVVDSGSPGFKGDIIIDNQKNVIASLGGEKPILSNDVIQNIYLQNYDDIITNVIDLPNSINCNNLNWSIKLKSSIEKINLPYVSAVYGTGIFSKCVNLVDVNLSSDIMIYKYIDGREQDSGMFKELFMNTAFYSNQMNDSGIVKYHDILVDVSPNLHEIDIKGLTAIGRDVANDNDNLVSVDLSDAKKIYPSFNRCSKLSSVTINSSVDLKFGYIYRSSDDIFSCCNNLSTFTVNQPTYEKFTWSSTSKNGDPCYSLIYWEDYDGNSTFPTIIKGSFATDLTPLDGSPCLDIAVSAFYGLTTLTSLPKFPNVIDDYVQLYEYSFAHTGLISVDLTFMDNYNNGWSGAGYQFEGCQNLLSAILPKTLIENSDYSDWFKDCPKLEYVDFSGNENFTTDVTPESLLLDMGIPEDQISRITIKR